ncbi:MAG: NUDIX hydrolase [Nanoarchaeota archaeon]|nr:NUDIX hydrolase [Nanoarchaeota archaeon]
MSILLYYLMDEEFKRYTLPATAVDLVLFSLQADDIKVGLIRRSEDPYKGSYVLPGRFVRYEEKIEDTARIALEEKGKLDAKSVKLEQLYTFGQDLHRDTRVRTISIVYYGVLPTDKFQEGTLEWFSLYELPKMGFDHKAIVLYAHERLKNKVLWDEFAFSFLPKEFTLSELQRIYELVLDKELDKRNFRKKIVEIKGLKKTAKSKVEGVHRPAALYIYSSSRKSLI